MHGQQVLGLALAYTLLIGVPGIAAGLFVAARGHTSALLTSAVGLAASAGTAIVTFWAYFALHDLGVLLSFAAPACGVAVIVWVVARRRALVASTWRAVCSPWCLWALGTVFLLALGFLFGGEAHPVATAAYRFSHRLPSDNYLPQYFAEGLFKARSFRAAPAYADWLSSDRPPLQVGYVVAARPYGWSTSGIQYQVVAVAVQQLWIVGAWALLASVVVRRQARALAMAALLVGDVAIVHGFYTWPKLIAVGFLLATAGIVLGDRWDAAALRAPWGALVGLLLGAAILCHGASWYAIIPLAVVAVIRRRPSWQFLGAVVAVVLVCQVPWMAYQHFADPPGDRLEKWMLAGQISVSNESLPRALIDAYTDTGLADIARYKRDNVDAVTGGGHGVGDLVRAVRLVFEGHPGEAVDVVRDVRFYSLLQNVGLLLLGMVVMLVAWLRRSSRAGPEWRMSLRLLAFVGGAIVFWIIVQYGNQYSLTTVHTASLAVPMLLAIGCVLGAASVSLRAAAVLVALNVVVDLLLYVPYLDSPYGTSFSPLLAVAGVAALGAFLAGALAFPGGASPSDRVDSVPLSSTAPSGSSIPESSR